MSVANEENTVKMSDYRQVRDAAGNVTSYYGKMLQAAIERREFDVEDVIIMENAGRITLAELSGQMKGQKDLIARIEQLVATCEELEAKLAEVEEERDKFHQLWKHACVRSGKNSLRTDAAEQRVATLESKLAKAVETISLCRKMQAQFTHTEDPLMVLLDTTIAELKGQKDE